MEDLADGPVQVFEEFEINYLQLLYRELETCAFRNYACQILNELATVGTRCKRVVRRFSCVNDKRKAEAVVAYIRSMIGEETYGGLAEWWTFGVHEGRVEAIPHSHTQEEIEADRARHYHL